MHRKRKPMSEAHKLAMTEGRRKAKEAKLAKQREEDLDTVLSAEANGDLNPEPQQGSNEVASVPEDFVFTQPESAKLEPQVAPEQPSTNREEVLLELIVNMQREMAEIRKNNADVLAAIHNNDPSVQVQAFETIAGLKGATISNQGVQGQVFKYPVEKSYYPDPTDRLYDDPQLRRFAMRENFYFKWDVTGETYEKHGISYTEPRFTVELWRLMFDPETGEPTGQMFLISRQMQHEDEFIARMAADKLGLKFDTVPDLLDEMRYYRLRDWLLAVFKPQPIHTHKNKVSQQVIGGKVVEVKDTEELTDKASANDQATTLNREIKLTPAETREAVRAGLL